MIENISWGVLCSHQERGPYQQAQWSAFLGTWTFFLLTLPVRILCVLRALCFKMYSHEWSQGLYLGKIHQGHLAHEQPVETSSLMGPACCGLSFAWPAPWERILDMSDQDLLSCCHGLCMAVFLGILSFHWEPKAECQFIQAGSHIWLPRKWSEICTFLSCVFIYTYVYTFMDKACVCT